jgi:hypothetical protein
VPVVDASVLVVALAVYKESNSSPPRSLIWRSCRFCAGQPVAAR